MRVTSDMGKARYGMSRTAMIIADGVRACASIVETVDAFNGHATVYRGMLRAEANSILELLMLTAQQGTELILRATGPDADTLLDALAELF